VQNRFVTASTMSCVYLSLTFRTCR